ncbi:MAG: hypothetical protein ACFB51_20720 [Anaerolineae bacterium]
MRRYLPAALIATALAAVLAFTLPGISQSDYGILADKPTTPVDVLMPADGARLSFNAQPDFIVEWTRVEDALWYYVRLSPVDGGDYVDYRYKPDQSEDWQLRNPNLTVATGLLAFDTPYTIEVSAYGPTQQLIDEFGEQFITLPTYLDVSYYELIGTIGQTATITVGG